MDLRGHAASRRGRRLGNQSSLWLTREGPTKLQGVRWRIITTPHMNAPDNNYLASAQSSSGPSQTERREVSEGQQSVCTYNTLPFHRAYIYQLIDIDFIYMLFSARSALPSSPLQILSNKSAPARLFNKHFAPSDECAALLKCLFSFCLGGQPTVVYLTVNKELESLQLHASSPQWSLAAFQRQRKKSGSIRQVPYQKSWSALVY